MTLTPGQRHEAIKAEELVAVAQAAAFIGDTGYDSNKIRQAIEAKGMTAVIHPKPEPEPPQAAEVGASRSDASQRNDPPPLDRDLYATSLVERFFHHLKRFRGVATRYDKTATNYLAMVHLACARIWLDQGTRPTSAA